MSHFRGFFFLGVGYGTTEGSLKIASPLAVASPSHHTLDNNTLQASSLQALSKCQMETGIVLKTLKMYLIS